MRMVYSMVAAEFADGMVASTLFLNVSLYESLVLLCAILKVASPDAVARNRPAKRAENAPPDNPLYGILAASEKSKSGTRIGPGRRVFSAQLLLW